MEKDTRKRSSLTIWVPPAQKDGTCNPDCILHKSNKCLYFPEAFCIDYETSIPPFGCPSYQGPEECSEDFVLCFETKINNSDGTCSSECELRRFVYFDCPLMDKELMRPTKKCPRYKGKGK